MNKFKDEEIIEIEDVVLAPINYNETELVLRGYFVNEFENVAIFPNRKSANKNHYKSGIWVDFPKSLMDNLEENNLTLKTGYVTLRGKFYSSDKGHLNQYIGTIEINCIDHN